VPTEQRDGIRFRFGRNWKSFVSTVDEKAITEAESGLRRLFPGRELAGKRFLDIGCGSGLSMLAALRLGAAAAHGIDIDRDSVEATQTLLARHAAGGNWSARQLSVFDADPATVGVHDVVYSWGVLHHTGAMWQAMDRAAALVAPGGLFAFALYRRTPLCALWKIEKRVYAAAPDFGQAIFRGAYKAAFVTGLCATGRNPRRYVADYRGARGMDWHHDVHDWLGGYPYESTEPGEVAAFLRRHGFTLERQFHRPPVASGLFGSHCDEYVALRVSARHVDFVPPTP
jgi:2-polyprenyl-6-hydroxyphenyl methylase/3-demethylubiquinone-9 3-methyltransferase